MLANEEMITTTYVNHYKVAFITSSVNKISLFVALDDKFTFVVAEMIFNVDMMASYMVKITFVVTEISFRDSHKLVGGQYDFCSG